MAAKKINARVEQMHRSALAVRTPVGLAIEFSHHRFGRNAFGDSLSVLSVTGNNIIVLANGRDSADANCFLADVKMAETADLAEVVGLGAFFFKAPNQEHLMK